MIDRQDLPKVTQVKIFGERHTATNAITAFIHQNFNAQCRYYDFLGWKHRRAPKRQEWEKQDYQNTLFIFTVRNPYTWLKALHREPYYPHQPQITQLNFRDFILHSIEDYENCIQMWNEKYRGYLKMSNDVPHSLFIRMEDFLKDQEDIYNKLSNILQPSNTFQPYEKYVSGLGEKDRSKLGSSTKLPPVPDITYKIINDQLDDNLVQTFDYQYANSSSDY